MTEAEFARLSPAQRSSLGAALSAAGKALLVREGGADAEKTEPFRTLAAALGILRGQDAPHALIGGWAVNVWGVVRATAVSFQGLDIPVVRPEDLIAMKLDAGGGLDWEDARAVYAVQMDALDEHSLAAVCARRGVLDRLELLRRTRGA